MQHIDATLKTLFHIKIFQWLSLRMEMFGQRLYQVLTHGCGSGGGDGFSCAYLQAVTCIYLAMYISYISRYIQFNSKSE